MEADNMPALDNGRYITNFEAAQILNSMKSSNTNPDAHKLQDFENACFYAERFAGFASEQQLKAAKTTVRELLARKDDEDEEDQKMSESKRDELDRQIDYATVVLLNLCPRTVEDARVYVPFLKNKSDELIEEIIDVLDRHY